MFLYSFYGLYLFKNIHTTECYSTLGRNEVLIYAIAWLNLWNIIKQKQVKCKDKAFYATTQIKYPEMRSP